MDSSPPHAVNITNAVVQDSIGHGIGNDPHQLSPTLSNPSQELIQQHQYTSNQQLHLGGNNQVNLDYTQQQQQQQHQHQHQQMLMYLRQQRAQFKSWRIKCFISQAISFLFAFITEQVTDQHFSVAVTTGLISIIFGFPIPIIFFNIVLKKYATRNKTGPQHPPSGAQGGMLPNRRDGFFERQIFALVMYMAAIVTATILLYEGLNREYKVVGMVIVTASFLVFSTLLIYVDLVDDEIEE